MKTSYSQSKADMCAQISSTSRRRYASHGRGGLIQKCKASLPISTANTSAQTGRRPIMKCNLASFSSSPQFLPPHTTRITHELQPLQSPLNYLPPTVPCTHTESHKQLREPLPSAPVSGASGVLQHGLHVARGVLSVADLQLELFHQHGQRLWRQERRRVGPYAHVAHP